MQQCRLPIDYIRHSFLSLNGNLLFPLLVSPYLSMNFKKIRYKLAKEMQDYKIFRGLPLPIVDGRAIVSISNGGRPE